MDIRSFKYYMEHSSRGMFCLARAMQLCGVKDVYHHIRAKKQFKETLGHNVDFEKFYQEHESYYSCVVDMLEDDLSKKTYEAILSYRRSYNIEFIKGLVVRPQYFLPKIVPPSTKERFVDGGEYVGDTAVDFLRYYRSNDDYMIYIWECDDDNIAQIHKILKGKKYEVVPYAMYDKQTQLHFFSSGTTYSRIDGDGDIFINAHSIDEIHRDHGITFIKLDIEGAEMNALRGAKNVIKQRKPKLAISIYHRPEHLYEIPLYIKSIVPEYRFYIRHHAYSFNETILYAVV